MLNTHKQLSQLRPNKTGGQPAVDGTDFYEEPDVSSSPIIGATAILAAKYPANFAVDKDNKSRKETRTVSMFIMFVLVAVGYGWTQWAGINFKADSEFAYNSGLIGGIIMLVVLLYAVVKRLKFMRSWGQMEFWYYFHLVGGVVGPLLIIFHSSFELKSINSGVAFVSMLLIVASGFFGRYVYTRVGYGLHRKLLDIKRTEMNLVKNLRFHHNELAFTIERRLADFALACLAGSKSLFRMPFRFLAIRTEAARCYIVSSGDITEILKLQAYDNGWSMDEYSRRLKAEKILIRHHINAIVDIANVHIWERLLVRWRILHIPLLYILLVTGLAHVLAVHMY